MKPGVTTGVLVKKGSREARAGSEMMKVRLLEGCKVQGLQVQRGLKEKIPSVRRNQL